MVPAASGPGGRPEEQTQRRAVGRSVASVGGFFPVAAQGASWGALLQNVTRSDDEEHRPKYDPCAPRELQAAGPGTTPLVPPPAREAGKRRARLGAAGVPRASSRRSQAARVAARLVVLPVRSDTTTWNVAPLSSSVAGGVV